MEQIKIRAGSNSKNNIAAADQEIPIFFITPNDIFPPAVVTAVSILENTKSKVKFYFLERKTLPVSRSNKETMEGLKTTYQNFSVEYVPIDPEPFDELVKRKAKYIPNDAYYRYIIPDLFPNLKKVIYLDVDVIVQCDIRELYGIDLEDNYIGAVNHPKYLWDENPDFYRIVSQLELDNPYLYVNSGVLLINCEKWRADRVSEKLMQQTIARKDRITWCDQDIINLVMQGKIKELPWSFNAILTHFAKHEHSPRDAKIIHYAGPRKPWNSLCPLRSAFWKYAKKVDLGKKLNQIKKMDKRRSAITYSLFKFIPILSVKKKKEETSYYLFGFIPLIMKRGGDER